MFLMQSYSRLLRPGNAADGPPYGAPGMWSTFGSYTTLPEATDGMRRVFSPDGTVRDPANYRIVEIDSKGRIRKVFFHDGREILTTPKQREALKQQRVPVIA